MAPPTIQKPLSRAQEAQMNKDLENFVKFARKEFSSISKGSLTELFQFCKMALIGDDSHPRLRVRVEALLHMSLSLSSAGSQASQAMISAFSEAWSELPGSVQGRLGEKLQGALEQFRAEKESRRKPNARIEPADKTDPLGEFAFSEEREDVPLEKDTSEEKRLYGELSAHFLEGSTASEGDAQMIRSFLVQGLYRDFFNPPDPREILYRGMSVSKEWLETALSGKIDPEVEEQEEIPCVCVFKPKKGIGITSWTDDREVARQFSYSPVGVKYGVTMLSRAGDNRNRFARVPSEDDLEGGLSVSHEHEVIGLGEIKVFAIEWSKL